MTRSQERRYLCPGAIQGGAVARPCCTQYRVDPIFGDPNLIDYMPSVAFVY